ncbi:MAG: hypothetical protein HC876_05425 [Chloroflexaceae bacterium]|nr:hypothetical protein [Chloroflexaceae bacterium]
MKTVLLQGSVATILNPREIAINIGRNNGVQVGMNFKIVQNNPVEIRDPASGELLGTLKREKARVRVVEAKERFAICRTYKLNILSNENIMESLTEPIPKEGIFAEDDYVKVGDTVVQILDEDE